jgi:serine/threonine protein kinase
MESVVQQRGAVRIVADPSPSQSTSLSPGEVIAGKYVVEHLLGRGGMASVYVVTHRFTGKRLALKCLAPEQAARKDVVERFLREAQAAGRIHHRHVADVFDVGRDGNVFYLVMPLLEGQPLAQLMKSRTLSSDELLTICARAMEGIAAAHAEGVVHRDIKPDNIFVCVGPTGRLDDPRVLDFGISKMDDDLCEPLTRSGVMMGTPYYMSLEQITGQRDLDQRVDVYAMGVILYEAYAGERPYLADTVGGLAVQMMQEPAVHLGDRLPQLPRALCNVVMRAIERERDLRYPSMNAFITALRPFLPRDSLARDGVTDELDDEPTMLSVRPERGAPTDEMSVSSTRPLKSPGVELLQHTADPHVLRRSQAPARVLRSMPFVLLGCAVASGLVLFGMHLRTPEESSQPLESRVSAAASEPEMRPIGEPLAPAPAVRDTSHSRFPAPEPNAQQAHAFELSLHHESEPLVDEPVVDETEEAPESAAAELLNDPPPAPISRRTSRRSRTQAAKESGVADEAQGSPTATTSTSPGALPEAGAAAPDANPKGSDAALGRTADAAPPTGTEHTPASTDKARSSTKQPKAAAPGAKTAPHDEAVSPGDDAHAHTEPAP